MASHFLKLLSIHFLLVDTVVAFHPWSVVSILAGQHHRSLHAPLKRSSSMRGSTISAKHRNSQKILVIGGSGRVGGSTVRHILGEAYRDKLPLEVVVGGRSQANFHDSMDRIKKKLVSDGIDAALVDESCSFAELDLESHDSLTRALQGIDLVVHTAGPFQQKTSPQVLKAAIATGTSYVDVCDEIALCKAAKALEEEAKEAKIKAIVSAGIWPGVSALMATKVIQRIREIKSEKLKKMSEPDFDRSDADERLDLSFFTAGTGNAGATIVSATFLLLAQEVVTFINGLKADVEPWTSPRDVYFGNAIGKRTVRLLDNPDVFTIHEALLVPNIASRFATAPGIWNQLFGAAKALPAELLSNREAMQKLSIFSLPIIRAVDRLVGATNSMNIEASNGDASITFTVTHEDLEDCVGLATAAFALDMLGDIGSDDTGIFFPAELSQLSCDGILERVRRTAIAWDWTEEQK